MNAKQELTALLSAHAPLIQIVTYEEQRVLRTLAEIQEARDLGIVSWDAPEGFAEHRPGNQPFPKKELTSDKLLKYVDEQMPQGTILVLKDFHHAWRAKRGDITRRLRNMVPRLRKTSRYIVMTTPPLPREDDLPLELKDDVVVLNLPLPTEAELERMFDSTVKNLDHSKLPRQDVKRKLIQSALGLTTTQARMAFLRVHAAYGKFDDRGIDLILLDLNMPGVQAFSGLLYLRAQHPEIPVVMLTAAGEVVDRIIGLEMGADDYLGKPVDLRELEARIKAVLRRNAASGSGADGAAASGKVRFGDYTLNLDAAKLTSEDGAEVSLTSMEFNLLKVFAQNKGRVLNRDQILEQAHDRSWDPFDRSIDIRISRLRRKIERHPEKPRIIRTVRGIGYVFDPDNA